MDNLLDQVPAWAKASGLWREYVRWANRKGGPGYFGKTLATPQAVVADFDLYARQARLGLPIGPAPLLGRLPSIPASAIGFDTGVLGAGKAPTPTPPPQKREKGHYGPANCTPPRRPQPPYLGGDFDL